MTVNEVHPLEALIRERIVVLVTDGICSGSDEGHDCLLTIYRNRYSEQIETADSESVLSAWS